MLGRVYTAKLARTAVSAGPRTLIELTAHTNRIVEVLRLEIGQSESETSTMEEVRLVRKSGAGTGTAHTPTPMIASDTAFGGTCRVDCTAEGTVSDELYAIPFNILNGLLWVPTPEERIIVAGAGIFGIQLVEAPEASIDISATLVFKEIG